MRDDTAERISITERVNGWWVTVSDASGHEEHHGPYPDQEQAQAEADLLAAQPPVQTER